MASFDRSDILRSFQLFHQTGDIREGRILNAGKFRTISGYFDDAGVMTDAVVGFADEPFPAYYFTLNPVRRDLFARSANKFTKYAKETTADADIIKRQWLPIDLYPIRPAGISSNEEEHAAAIQKATDIREWLISKGWQAGAFILADSGNGGHLAAKIDLPNDEASRDLVKSCLEALDATFSDDIVKVDTTTYNAARIWKIYGTAARKGSDTDDRPHRIAKILEAPDELVTISREQLEELAAIRAMPKGQRAEKSHTDFDPRQYAEAHGATVAKVKNGWVDPKGKRWTLAILEECPFNADHNRAEAWVGVADSGERGFGCPHDGCKGNDWHALRELWEPDRKFAEANPPLTRERCDMIEAETGVHIFNAEDDPNPNAISEEELNAYSLPAGPKFDCQLPKEHFIQRFMAYGSDISDAYIEYWFAGGLFALAAIADKKIKVVLKQGTIYPNLYISINGKSSLARKSTVVDKAEAMLCQVKPSLLPALVPTEFSPEAFTEHLSDYNHAAWVRDEAAGVLSLMKKDYMRGFKDSLMQLYDSKPFYRKLRTSQRKGAKTEFRVDDPYLNLLWATTDASLGANTEQNDTLSGFMARFLFFFPQGAKDKWLPLEEGTAANSVFEGLVHSQLTGIAVQVEELQECQAMHFSPEAASYYTEWQRVREQEWTASNDGNAMQLYSRLAPTVIKLAMLFELGMPGFDPSRPIRGEFIEEACRLVDSYFMPTAIAVYELVGANAEKNRLDKIVAYLKKHNGKAQKRDVLRATRLTKSEFDEAVDTMIESGEIEERPDDPQGKGRPRIWILLNSVNNVITVNKVINVNKVNRDKSRFSREGEFCDNSDKNDKMDKIDKKDNWSDSEDEKPKSGFQRFKSGMKKRICCLCGRSFAYDLTPYFNKGQSGYICATCHMEGPPPEPEKANPQTKLEAGA
jgi:predicted transcriptional regulator